MQQVSLGIRPLSLKTDVVQPGDGSDLLLATNSLVRRDESRSACFLSPPAFELEDRSPLTALYDGPARCLVTKMSHLSTVFSSLPSSTSPPLLLIIALIPSSLDLSISIVSEHTIFLPLRISL